ncbi:MAG: hypothetical protein AAGI92_10185 [Pseudomonadota bacterium]
MQGDSEKQAIDFARYIGVLAAFNQFGITLKIRNPLQTPPVLILLCFFGFFAFCDWQKNAEEGTIKEV